MRELFVEMPTVPVLRAAILLSVTQALAFQDLKGSLGDLPRTEQGTVTHSLEKGLSDPNALQFRNVHRRVLSTSDTGFEVMICGEANA